MTRRARHLLLPLALLAACESPNPQPCLVETPREVELSTHPLDPATVYTTEQVEIAMTPRTFEEMRETICERADFLQACAELVALSGNPPTSRSAERVRDRVIGYILAAALDLGRVTVRERSSGELVPMIVAESYQDTCGTRHRIGRRYSLPGVAPFLEVRDL